MTKISTVLFAAASLAVLSFGAARAEGNEGGATRIMNPNYVTAAVQAAHTDGAAAPAASALSIDHTRDAGKR